MKNKTALSFSIFIGVVVHLVCLYTIHHMHLGTVRHTVNALNVALNKNDEYLKEIFNDMDEITYACDEDIVLKAEDTPVWDIPFPKREPSFEFLSLDTQPLKYDLYDTSLIMDHKDSVLFSENVSMDLPPCAEFSVQNDSYESFGPLCGSEDFDLQVEYAPKRFRPGYVFKITLIPRSHVEFKRIHQNYYFILDRSNSIPRVRYLLNKRAVSEALDLLHDEDHFNIFVFDSHVVRLKEEPVSCTKENIALARSFLDMQAHGGHFAATELYTSLSKILPSNPPDKEINTAILLSDGDTYLSSEKQRQAIGGWTLKNQGKVSLYCAATGTGNNLPLMELLSAFNKGALIYAQDHRQIADRLKGLIRTIQNPIGKDIVPTAVPIDKQMNILLQPKRKRLSDLYQNRPFVVYGSTNRLADFVLFLQGKYYESRFDIKKTVSFSHAQVGSPSIERQWTSLLSQEFYERFFEDGNIAHLEAAKQLLLPLNLPIAFLD